MKKSTRFLAVMLSILLLLGAVPGSFAAGSISTPAAGAVVMDFQTGELYFAKNADKARPAASMTKLMSAYMILEEISSGRLAPDTLVTASDKAAAISRNPAYSGMERLTAGQSYPADTLLKLALVHSCNGSIIALAEHVGGGSEEAFVQRMNEKTAEWGLDARFADSSGFIDRGNAVSPRAMAEIGRHILIDHPEVLNYTSLHSVTFQGKTFNSTNTLMRNGTVEGIDGFKTGCTDGAGYCFTGTASRDGRRMISVVMGADSYRSRMSESRKLLEYGFTCRAEREAAWAKTADRVRADIKSEDGLAHSFMKNHFTATMSGVEGTIPCSVSWDVGGQVVDMGMTTISNGSVLELVCTPPPTASSLPVTLSLTLPNGHVVRQESRIKAAPSHLLRLYGHWGDLPLSGRQPPHPLPGVVRPGDHQSHPGGLVSGRRAPQGLPEPRLRSGSPGHEPPISSPPPRIWNPASTSWSSAATPRGCPARSRPASP